MTIPTPDTTSEITVFDASSSSSNPYLNILLLGNKWGGPVGSAATVYYSFPTSRSDEYWSQDFINGYGINNPTPDFKADYVSLTPLNSSQQNGITLALNAWANVANLDFIKVNETPTTVGDIRFGFTSDGSMSPNIYAYTYTVDPDLYEYSDILPYNRSGDVWFNKTQPSTTGNNFSTGAMGYFVGLHEIGHALGLDHSFAEEDEEGDIGLPTNIDYIQHTVMSYSDMPGTHFDGLNEYYPTTPMLYDILAIQHLYGANNSYNADDTVYEFSSSQRYYQTIWDAGGNDTIKYVSAIGGVINLDAGSFSQLGRSFKVGPNNETTQQENVAIAFNVLIENAIGGNGNDLIYGNSSDNILDGSAGNDTLDGKGGNDTLIGGKGNDTYIIDNSGVTVTEGTNEGIDQVHASVSYVLAANVENLLLTSNGNIDGTGNALANTITGNAGNNTLDGGAGIDKLAGGLGNDTYLVDLIQTGTTAAAFRVALQDTITEAANAGSDTVKLRGDFDHINATTLALGVNLENLDASATGTTRLNLTGNALANTLTGNDADNIFDGSAGADTLIGGDGDDTYMLDLKTSLINNVVTAVVEDTVIETSGNGTDTIKLRGAAALGTATTLTLNGDWENVEILDASATGSTKLNLTANNNGNTLIGNAAANILTGGIGNDTLNGGAGIDIMIGGAGNDVYIVDNIADQIIETATTLQIVSSSSAGLTANNSSTSPSFSADGRYVAFQSSASNLVSGDTNNGWDVFVKDLQTGTVQRISTSSTGAQGTETYSRPGETSFSADGRYVLFTSSLEGLNPDAGYSGGYAHIYLKNLQTGEIQTVDTSSDGVLATNHSTNVSLSSNNRYVMFTSEDSNLVNGDTNGRMDIYIKDLQTGHLNLVSRDSAGNISDGGSWGASFLPGGNSIIFQSSASNLVNNDTNGSLPDIFIKNLLTGTVTLVSTNALGAQGNGYSYNPSVSADGQYFAFTTTVNFDGNDLYGMDIYIKNLQTGAIKIVSTNALGEYSNSQADGAVVSSDGRYVVFTSLANNLVPGDANNENDVFIKDLVSGDIKMLSGSAIGSSRSISGEYSYTDLSNRGFSPDNKFILFSTVADNPNLGDLNGSTDILLVSNPFLIGGGTDLVQASVTYTLGANIENLELTGTAAINGNGNSLANIITGNTGNNILDGKGGNDTLIGGKGNDTYIIDNSGVTVIEGTNEGIDQVNASVNYVLAANVENLLLAGNGNISGTGNELANTITGNAGSNTLDGGAGVDKLIGGLGNDIYKVDLALTGTTAANYKVALQDTITETAVGGSGTDIVQLRLLAGTDYSAMANATTLTLGANLENLDASLTADTRLNLTGNALANTLTGNDADNILDGGAGVDTLIGGEGDDTYVLDLKTATINGVVTAVVEDTVTETGGTTSIDTIKLRGAATLATATTLTLNGDWANAEVLDASATGSTKLNLTANNNGNTLIGNAAANLLTGGNGHDTLNGGAGIDTMNGGNGNDTYIVDNTADIVNETNAVNSGTDLVQASVTYTLGANVENLELTGTAAINGNGNSLVNTITGNAGNNILDGKGGNDTLIGGKGNDTYIIDNSGVTVTEGTNEGIDQVNASVSYVLAANVENLLLAGSGNIDGTGNALANTITGNAGNNTLDGGAGIDKLAGGLGNDTYLVDLIQTGTTAAAFRVALQDTITEAANAGSDTVKLRGDFDHINATTLTLGVNLENLDASATGTTKLSLTGNTLGNTLTGNDADNILDGGAGVDTLIGGKGDDTYILDLKLQGTGAGATVVIEDTVTELNGTTNGVDTVKLRGTANLTAVAELSLIGNWANIEILDASATGSTKLNLKGNNIGNTLIGNAAANTLTGGTGEDTLNGGAGIDTMIGGNGDDIYIVDNINDVVTELANGGSDEVQASVSYSLALAANVENLTLTGTAAINGNGNADINVITGNTSNNILDGKGGNDTLIGGKGNDTYIIDNSGVTVIEGTNEGIDQVNASVSYTLAANVENLLLAGSANINGTGNALANTITGNVGNNILDGGDGADKLIGGQGDDTYIVDLQVKDRYIGSLYMGSYLILEDTIIEAKNAGSDTLVLRGSAPGGYSFNLIDNIENLDAQSVIRVDGPGDGINLYGNALDNRIWGNNNNNWIGGGAGNDTLYGGGGEDYLDGGEGMNILIGGQGSDTYIIRSSADLIYELPSDYGVDHIFTFVSINLDLFPGIEYAQIYYGAQNVVISSNSGNIYGGSDKNDQLIGSTANDTFLASTGNDTLTGGLGADTFIFNLVDKGANGKPSIDKITDFNSAEDKLDIKDLLIGESSGNILNYLDITTSMAAGVTNTEIRISNTGGFTNGNYFAAAENHHITLAGVNLLSGTNEAALLANLISQNKLVIDV
jgi:serralysin